MRGKDAKEEDRQDSITQIRSSKQVLNSVLRMQRSPFLLVCPLPPFQLYRSFPILFSLRFSSHRSNWVFSNET